MELMLPRDENSGPVGMGLQMGGRGPSVQGLAGRVHESLKNSNPPSKGRAFGTPLGGKGGNAVPGKQRRALGNITNQTPVRRALGDITNSKASGSKPVQHEAVKTKPAPTTRGAQSLVERYALEGVEGWAGGATGHQLVEERSRAQDAKLKAKVMQLTSGGGGPLLAPWGSNTISDEEVMRVNGGVFDPDLVEVPVLSLIDLNPSDTLLDDLKLDKNSLPPVDYQTCAFGLSLTVKELSNGDVDVDLDED